MDARGKGAEGALTWNNSRFTSFLCGLLDVWGGSKAAFAGVVEVDLGGIGELDCVA
mgnify:CR=1 FL=1